MQTLRSLALAGALLAGSAALSGCQLLDQVRRAAGPAGPAVASVDATRLSFPALRDIPVADVRRVTLSNGLVVFLVEDRTLPTVGAQARIAAGTLLDPPRQVGLTRVAATVLRSGGAGDRDPDALNLALENVGASIEAGAGQDASFVSMRALTETLDEVLPLFADVVRRPRFDAQQVTLAKTQQRASIARRNDNPQGIANRELGRALYGAESPYAAQTEYWTIDAVNRQSLVNWHERHVHPAATTLAVWGDFDADAMVARLEAAFGSWEAPAGAEVPDVPESTAQFGRRILFVEKTDVNQSTVLVGHPGEILQSDPDYPAVVVMNEILGGGFSGRLLKTIRTDLGLAYAVFGGYSAGYRVPGLFSSGTFTKSESTVQAARAMLDVIEGMRTTAPSADELRLAKEAYLNSFVFNFENRTQVLGRRLTYEAYGYPADFLERLKDRVEAVTAADVQRVAQRYLHPDRAVLLVLGNPADFDEPLSALGTVETVDIAIPTAPPGGAAAPIADESAAREALGTVADALGGREAFAAIRTLRTESETQATIGGQALTIGGTTAVRLPETVRAEQRLPFGAVTVLLADGRAQIQSPGGVEDAPAVVVEQIRTQLYLSVPYLLARLDELTVAALPGGALQIRAPGIPTPFLLTLGDDGRPAEMRVTQLTAEGPSELVVRIEDYREAGGLIVPFRYIQQNAAGEVTGRTQLSAIDVNPALGAATFRLGE
jgi:predicted Zn-dependent peptidase